MAVVVVMTIINHGGIEVDVGSVVVIVLVNDRGCGHDCVIDTDGHCQDRVSSGLTRGSRGSGY